MMHIESLESVSFRWALFLEELVCSFFFLGFFCPATRFPVIYRNFTSLLNTLFDSLTYYNGYKQVSQYSLKYDLDYVPEHTPFFFERFDGNNFGVDLGDIVIIDYD